MQTVTNNYNTMNINLSRSNINFNGSNPVALNNGSSVLTWNGSDGALSGLVFEAIRIFSGLDIKDQAKALVYLCELEARVLPAGR